MLSKSALHTMLVTLVAVATLTVHSPVAYASTAPVRTASKCPIKATMCAFASVPKMLGWGGGVRSKPAAPALTSSTFAPTASFVRPHSSLTSLSMVASIPKTDSVAASASGEDDQEVAEKRAKRIAAASTALDVHVLGLSHHNAAVDVREKLAIPQDQWVEAATALVESSGGVIAEAAVLSTCNRFEVYFSARDSRAAMRAVTEFLADRSQLSQGVLRRNLFMLGGEDASWHLLRVSAGLDSLVVGEGQILSQVAACYQAAISEGGQGGKVLSRMLNQAVASGKRVRSETSISKGAVSISSAAVEFSQQTTPKVLNKDFKDCSVVIVGAGKMSRLLITHLKSHGITKIVLVNRSVGPGSRAAELAEAHDDVEWELRPMEDMYAAIADADVVYMSTASEVPIVTATDLTDALAKVPSRGFGSDLATEGLCLVDISVPRNVETEVEDVAGVYSYNVDHLKAVVARNTAARRREILEAEALLREEHTDYHGWHQSLGAVPTIAKLQERVEEMRAEEMAKNSKKLKALSEKELDAVDRLSRGIVNKLLHGPMAHLRAPEGPEDKRRTLSTLNALFQLTDDGASKKGKKGKGKGKK